MTSENETRSPMQVIEDLAGKVEEARRKAHDACAGIDRVSEGVTELLRRRTLAGSLKLAAAIGLAAATLLGGGFIGYRGRKLEERTPATVRLPRELRSRSSAEKVLAGRELGKAGRVEALEVRDVLGVRYPDPAERPDDAEVWVRIQKAGWSASSLQPRPEEGVVALEYRRAALWDGDTLKDHWRLVAVRVVDWQPAR